MAQIGVVAFGLSLLASWAAVAWSTAGPTPAARPTPNSFNTDLDSLNGGGPADYCRQVQQQNHVDLKKISGGWHVVEIIGHRESDRKFGNGQLNLTVCPTMNVYMTTDEKISMWWHDPKGTVHYNFQVHSEEDPGFWNSVGQQTGSYVTNKKLNYIQFAGSVQVLKAVATHLILRFCSLGNHHYSIVMSRLPNISQQMIVELNNDILSRGLPLWDVKRACLGSASAFYSTMPLIVLTTGFATLLIKMF